MFPLFSHLPHELRYRIWFYAIPHASNDKPAVFFHEHRFMRLWVAPPEDKEWYMPDSEHNMHLRYFYEELDPVPVAISLIHVNQEARAAACFHAEKLGYEVFHNPSKSVPILGRRINRVKDILYYKYNGLIDFDEYRSPELEALDITFIQVFGLERHGCCARECVDDYFRFVFFYIPDTVSIYVFMSDENDELNEINTGGVQKHRIEFDQGRAWCFNNKTRQWAWGPGENIADDKLNKEIEAFNEDLSSRNDSVPDQYASQFRIVPVEARVVQV